MSDPFHPVVAGLRAGITPAAAKGLMTAIVPVVARFVVAATPTRTGHLRRQTSHDVLPNDYGVIRNSAAYAVPVHDGSRPHIIEAKNGVLAFTIGGKKIFAKRVRHPGNKPNPFMQRGLDAAMPTLTGLLGQWGATTLAGMITR